MIVVRVKNRGITAAPLGPVTAGSVGLPVKFHFGCGWDELAKVAVFRVGNTYSEDIVILDDSCIVPQEMLAQEYAGENLFVGVYGRDLYGSVAMPTIWTHVRIEDGTEPHDVDPTAPTPEWTQQVIQAADEAVRAAHKALSWIKPVTMHFEIDGSGHLIGDIDNSPLDFFIQNGHFCSQEAEYA